MLAEGRRINFVSGHVVRAIDLSVWTVSTRSRWRLSRVLFEAPFRAERSGWYLNGPAFTSKNCWRIGSGRVSVSRSPELNRWSKHDAL